MTAATESQNMAWTRYDGSDSVSHRTWHNEVWQQRLSHRTWHEWGMTAATESQSMAWPGMTATSHTTWLEWGMTATSHATWHEWGMTIATESQNMAWMSYVSSDWVKAQSTWHEWGMKAKSQRWVMTAAIESQNMAWLELAAETESQNMAWMSYDSSDWVTEHGMSMRSTRRNQGQTMHETGFCLSGASWQAERLTMMIIKNKVFLQYKILSGEAIHLLLRQDACSRRVGQGCRGRWGQRQQK